MDFNNGYGGMSSKFTFDKNYADCDELDDQQQKEGKCEYNQQLQIIRIKFIVSLTFARYVWLSTTNS